MKAFKLMVLLVAIVACGSCKKKEPRRTIVTKVVVPTVREGTTAMDDETAAKRFLWDGVYCEASVSRTADKELPTVSDADGNKYFDNKITLSITSADGKVVSKVFRKSDFAAYINSQYVKPSHSVLLNIVFHEVRSSRAVFIATIGSPDERDDVYMLVEAAVTKSGDVSMARVEAID